MAAVPATGSPPPFASVYFDCDSTLVGIEGIDELLQQAPAALRAEILNLTEQAMNGDLPLAEVYATRLQKLRPHRDDLQRIGELYCQHLVPDAERTIAALSSLGKRVGIVSGGLLEPVRAVAARLGIQPSDAHAVPLRFAADGSYVDFDRSSPLWRNGGKSELLRSLPADHRPLAFVGDGITDLETADTAERFVGYGGVVVRPAVQQRARYYSAAASLAGVLPFLLQPAEAAALAADPRYAGLLSPPPT